MKKTMLVMGSLGALAAGCGSGDDPINSNAVTTSDLTARYQVVQDESQRVTAEAQFTTLRASTSDDRNAELRAVTLVRQDQLWLSRGEKIEDNVVDGDLFESLANFSDGQNEFQVATASSLTFLFGPVNYRLDWYSATLESDDDRAYRISLYRTGSAPAENSYVVLPKPYDLIEPLLSDTFSRSIDNIEVLWEVSDEINITIDIHADTFCPGGGSYSLSETLTEDTGRYVFRAGDIASDLLSGTCNTTLTVAKVALGELDPLLRSGLIEGRQVRSVGFRTID